MVDNSIFFGCLYYFNTLLQLHTSADMSVLVCFLDQILAQQVEILFHGVASILKCHLQFRTVLSPAINCWDKVCMVDNCSLNFT